MGILNKIVLHWTAGGYYPNSTDLQHYHFLIDKDGNIHKGALKPKDNINCNDGLYAAHCGGGNTGAIGVSLCGMAGYQSITKPGKYFITKKQCEAMFKLAAQLCIKYNIPIDKVITHAEFGYKNPKTSSNGKIDITALPPCYDVDVTKETLNAKEGTTKGKRIIGYGNFIRNKIRWYYNKELNK